MNEYLEQGGQKILFLDGYDKIENNYRKNIFKNYNLDRYEKLKVIITTIKT